jgi:adenylate cyclase
MFKRSIVLIGIGILVFITASLAKRKFEYQSSIAQVAASDWMMVKSQGLRLGARPVHDDIVLVFFDVKTATELGYVRSYDDDLQLYKKLVESGARIVYDTRSVAAADQANFDEVRPLLDGMKEIRPDGTLMRDAYLGWEILADTHPLYTPLMCQNLVNSNPHAIPSVRSRFYPMFHLTAVGPRESAPLMIARQIWGEPSGDSDSISTSMRNSGVMTIWHQQAPELVPEIDLPVAPYPIGERSIPWMPFLTSTVLVAPASFWVNYDPAVGDYTRYSYLDVLRETVKSEIDNKIVIVGFSHETDISADTYDVPCAVGKASPAEVMAVALQTLLDGKYLREPPKSVQWLTVAVVCVVFALVGGLLKPVQALLAIFAGLLFYAGYAVSVYRVGWFSDFAVAPAAGLTSGVLGLAYSSWLSVRSRHRVVDLFGRYVPRAVVNQLMLQGELQSLTMGGTRRDVTVMFADIRGFTSFSEDLAPEEVVRQLNSLLEIMVQCTFEQEGTLDKFIGDAILVLFNAPLEQPDHVARAVRTATEIQKRLSGHSSGLSVGIGLHRGQAVVGNIGTQQRLEYTAIGSTVNIASRLCGIAQPGEIILSSAMIDEVGEGYKTESLGPVTVKGLKVPLESYRVCCSGDSA